MTRKKPDFGTERVGRRPTPTQSFTMGDERCPTPIPASVSTTYHSRFSYPWNGGTYSIRDRESRLAITLKGDHLSLCPREEERIGNSHHPDRSGLWNCVEVESMWLGFYNDASGKFIGHGGGWWREWIFVAEAERHDQWRCFCARQHPDGGHILLVEHWHKFLPMALRGKKNRELVVDYEDRKGSAWDFIRTDSEIYTFMTVLSGIQSSPMREHEHMLQCVDAVIPHSSRHGALFR